MPAPDPIPAPPAPSGGGILLVLGMLGGAAIGFAMGQATIGFLAGGAIGLVAVLIQARRR